MAAVFYKFILVIVVAFSLSSCGDSSGSLTQDDGTVDISHEEAYRLLLQATFGPTAHDLEQVKLIGIKAWVNQQLSTSSAYDAENDAHQTHFERTTDIARSVEPTAAWDDTSIFNQSTASANVLKYQMAAWWENAIGLHPVNTRHGRDQLRQRVAYALSQIMVASPGEIPILKYRGEAQAFYFDILARNAFGNFRTLLGQVARSPAMGIFLSYQGNRKSDLSQGTRPDENFARELMQLFTIGLYQLNLDGSPNRDNNPATHPDAGNKLVPTYTQTDIEELAKVMTGWDMFGNPKFGSDGLSHGNLARPMEFTANWHEDELAEGGDGYVTVLGKYFSLNSGADSSGLDGALDLLFNHPNTGPFISRQLIMRMVTSNPSSAYIARTASVFNDNGHGVRGDLKAVIRAILLDEEARTPRYTLQGHYGKIKEPVLAWSQLLRAFSATPLNGWKSLGNHPVEGVYWHPHPERQLLQAAMRSPSVFNFYSPDYKPGGSYFSDNSIVSPELEIRTEHVLLAYSNLVYSLVNDMEKNSITKIMNRSVDSHAAHYRHSNNLILMISFDKELAIFEQALDGDKDGNFSNMKATASDGIPFKEKAVDALLVHLDQLLLGNAMQAKYRAAMKEYLLKSNDLNHENNFIAAHRIIKNAVHLMATSSAYMLQK